jgi:hypothetical protein
MMYSCHFDDNPKKSIELKIQEAIATFESRFFTKPQVVLVNEQDLAQPTMIAGVLCRVVEPSRDAAIVCRKNLLLLGMGVPV